MREALSEVSPLERELAVIPPGPGSILKVSTILSAYLIDQDEFHTHSGHV